MLHAFAKKRVPVLVLDFQQVSYVDSSGLATLIEYVRLAQDFGGKFGLISVSDRVKTIFDLVRLTEFFPIYPSLVEARAGFAGFPRRVKEYFALNGQILYWMLVAPFRGQPFKVSEVFHQIVLIGVRALPMASLTTFSIGLTLAMQAAGQLKRMGAEAFVPDLVILSLLRELGPLLTGVIVIGRSGSAVTAELGTMKVSEEIEALQVMAINPIRFLIVPRFLAMLVMLPVLTIFGNYVGMVGGWTICHYALDYNTSAYIYHSVTHAPTRGTCIPGSSKVLSSRGSSSRLPAILACRWRAARKAWGRPRPARWSGRCSSCSSPMPCSPRCFSSHERCRRQYARHRSNRSRS